MSREEPHRVSAEEEMHDETVPISISNRTCQMQLVQ